MGVSPSSLPVGASVTDPAVRGRFAQGWGGVPGPENAGKDLFEIVEAAGSGAVRFLYVIGDNPVMALPDEQRVRTALGKTEFLVVEDSLVEDDQKVSSGQRQCRVGAAAEGRRPVAVGDDARLALGQHRQRAVDLVLPDGDVLGDPGGCQLLIVQLCVCSRGVVDRERLCVVDVRKVAEQLERLDERLVVLAGVAAFVPDPADADDEEAEAEAESLLDTDFTQKLFGLVKDIKKLAGSANGPVPWAWYEEGYDLEPTDTGGTASHTTYIAHHDAPQYFGYESNNPNETAAHMKGLGDFFTALNATALPGTGTGGVYYVRGGYGNLDGLIPRSPSPAVQAAYAGNDDHPGYSDAQISEALLGDTINAIANSPYWPQSAIIITYDETDGLYDHTQPNIRSWDPLNNALSQGPRIPTIVISPFGVVHAISHEATEHGSIIRFVDELFKLTPLADLPDEAQARTLGLKTYGQKYLGPTDAGTPGIGDLFSGFDNGRLTGQTPPLPASYAVIPQSEFSLPHFGGQGCRVLEITPTDVIKGGVIDPAPQDFNPRPGTNPGVPYQGGWPTN